MIVPNKRSFHRWNLNTKWKDFTGSFPFSKIKIRWNHILYHGKHVFLYPLFKIFLKSTHAKYVFSAHFREDVINSIWALKRINGYWILRDFYGCIRRENSGDGGILPTSLKFAHPPTRKNPPGRLPHQIFNSSSKGLPPTHTHT